MTLLFTDGYDGYNSGTDMNTLYQYVNASATFVTGRFGKQKAVQFNINNLNVYIFALNFATVMTTATVGFALQIAQPQRGATLAVYFQDTASGVPQMSVEFCAMTGQVFVRRSTGGVGTGVILYQTGMNLFTVGPWYYVEIQPVINATAGSVIVRINGVTVVSQSSLNTQYSSTAGFDNIAMVGGSVAGVSGTNLSYVRFDDFYVCDSTGSAPYNGFLGDVRVQTLFPAANGSFAQFTPLTSIGYTQVRDTSADGDGSYNYAGTAGLRDTFPASGGGLLGSTATVFGVQVKSMQRRDNTSGRTVQNRLLSGTSGGAGDVGGVIVASSSSYDYLIDMFQNDPATSAAWTVTGANAVQYGYQIVA